MKAFSKSDFGEFRLAELRKTNKSLPTRISDKKQIENKNKPKNSRAAPGEDVTGNTKQEKDVVQQHTNRVRLRNNERKGQANLSTNESTEIHQKRVSTAPQVRSRRKTGALHPYHSRRLSVYMPLETYREAFRGTRKHTRGTTDQQSRQAHVRQADHSINSSLIFRACEQTQRYAFSI